MSFSQLRSFITSNLREVSLDTGFLAQRQLQEAQSFLDCLATTEGLRLRKFKLECSSMNEEFVGSVARVSAANKHSIETLEIVGLSLDVSLIVDQSLRNLKALDFDLRQVEGEETPQLIQTLVE
ncbi:hypothetical protein FRC00_013615, partial [Tulasnella sp. 408]